MPEIVKLGPDISKPKKGRKKIVTCEWCESEISFYGYEARKEHQNDSWGYDFEDCINCPACKDLIYVSQLM